MQLGQVGEPEFPPGFYQDDYVPDVPSFVTETPVPVTPDTDLAVTGGDSSTLFLVGWILIPFGIAALLGHYFATRKV